MKSKIIWIEGGVTLTVIRAITVGLGVYWVDPSVLEGFREAQNTICLPEGRSWHILVEPWPN
ncbi:MAG: hypothetical protein PVH80_07355 [Anaerolineae bacterium]|jgi:hypothetical protein